MKKDIILVLLAVMLCAFFVLNTDFKTVEEYYLEHAEDVSGAQATVFITIRCDDILANPEKLDPALAEYVPENGIILEKTEYVLRGGDTAFDILARAAKTRKIQMEYMGSAKAHTAYVEGISYLYEFSCGELSGWTYLVNGERPQVGASAFTLSNGDVIEWVYDCDLTESELSGGAGK